MSNVPNLMQQAASLRTTCPLGSDCSCAERMEMRAEGKIDDEPALIMDIPFPMMIALLFGGARSISFEDGEIVEHESHRSPDRVMEDLVDLAEPPFDPALAAVATAKAVDFEP